jgi:hypothetical protein
MLRGMRTPLVAVAALALAGCGGPDYKNEPRPATPLAVTASLSPEKVSVSPARFGAGLAVITITNLADEPETLVVEGPVTKSSRLIDPGDTADLKIDFKSGVYRAKAGANPKAKPETLQIGRPRPSAQNELLEP